jgi:hypothetical protein
LVNSYNCLQIICSDSPNKRRNDRQFHSRRSQNWDDTITRPPIRGGNPDGIKNRFPTLRRLRGSPFKPGTGPGPTPAVIPVNPRSSRGQARGPTPAVTPAKAGAHLQKIQLERIKMDSYHSVINNQHRSQVDRRSDSLCLIRRLRKLRSSEAGQPPKYRILEICSV